MTGDQCAACPVWTGECPLCETFHYLRGGKRFSIRKARLLRESPIGQAWQEFTEQHAGAMQDVSEQAGRLMAVGDREGLADLVNTHGRGRPAGRPTTQRRGVIPEHCPTCGGAVEISTADEGTSSFRPSRPRLLTDEMVERAARELGWEGPWRLAGARAVLEAALEPSPSPEGVAE